MYTIYTDVEFSRRKRLHHIIDDTDSPVWSGNTIVAAFDQLLELGCFEFRIEGQGPDQKYLVQIHRD